MSGTSVVGRTGSKRVYKYPDPPRGGAAVPYARNFATGPKTGMTVDEDQTQISWNAIDVGTSPGTDVPITPLSTGVVRILGVLSFFNSNGDSTEILVIVQVDGVDLLVPADERVTVPAGGYMTCTFLAETDLPIGSTSNVQITVNTPDPSQTASLLANSSSIEVQEVPVSTG